MPWLEGRLNPECSHEFKEFKNQNVETSANSNDIKWQEDTRFTQSSIKNTHLLDCGTKQQCTAEFWTEHTVEE